MQISLFIHLCLSKPSYVEEDSESNLSFLKNFKNTIKMILFVI